MSKLDTVLKKKKNFGNTFFLTCRWGLTRCPPSGQEACGLGWPPWRSLTPPPPPRYLLLLTRSPPRSPGSSPGQPCWSAARSWEKTMPQPWRGCRFVFFFSFSTTALMLACLHTCSSAGGFFGSASMLMFACLAFIRTCLICIRTCLISAYASTDITSIIQIEAELVVFFTKWFVLI